MKKVIKRIVLFIVAMSWVLVTGCTPTSPCPQGLLNHDATAQLAPLRASMSLRLQASPNELFEYLSDQQTLPEWMPGLESVAYDHSASSTPETLGEGSLRTMMFGDQAEVEKIVQFDPPNLIAYQILEGVPLRNHLAIMRIEESDDGRSDFTWYQYFDIKRSSVFGWLMPFMVKRFMNEAQENLMERFGGERVKLDQCLLPTEKK